MWQKAFCEVENFAFEACEDRRGSPVKVSTLDELKPLLDWVHIKHCLLRPYFETPNYPLVEARELLPSFEVDLYEYKELPGFSMVALERPLSSFHELFQFDMLHAILDWQREASTTVACPLESTVIENNLQTLRSRLPRREQDAFLKSFIDTDVCALENYPPLLPFLLHLERAHVLALDGSGDFCLQGVYASLPSELDNELKRFGLQIGKFRPGNNRLYECNRLFVYQYLMELYGFGIVSERRTSSAMFSRRLHRMGERFMVRVLGQSDRTLTTIMSPEKSKRYPYVEKTALVQIDESKKEAIELLRDHGYFIDEKRRVVILRVVYKQHKFNAKNVREDRALSILRQEIIHPMTGVRMISLNVISDASSMLLQLNDIVRGEFQGSITYKRQDIIQDTDTHEKRLKFLYSWLTKHQRRIIGYSDEFYSQVVRVLDSYLLNPDHYQLFNEMYFLHQEVWSRYSFIQQARKIKILEDLRHRHYKGENVNYLDMLRLMTEIFNDLKFEIVNYFESLVKNALDIGEDVLNDRYLQRTYVEKSEDDLSAYGQSVRKYYGRLVSLLDEFRSIRKSRRGMQDMQQPAAGF